MANVKSVVAELLGEEAPDALKPAGKLPAGLLVLTTPTGAHLYGTRPDLQAVLDLYQHVRRRYAEIDTLKSEVAKLKGAST